MDAQGCHFIDASRGWAVGTPTLERFVSNHEIPQDVGVIFQTSDGGKTWQQQQVALPPSYFEEGVRWYLMDVFFADQRLGWTAGFGVILGTTDGGESWNPCDVRKGIYGSIRFLNKEFGWATERWGSGLSITTDGGKHWKFLDGPPSFGNWATSAVFVTPQRGYAAILDLYETRDGGRSWTPLNSRETGRGYVYLGRARDGALVALCENEGRISALISNDNGESWQPTD